MRKNQKLKEMMEISYGNANGEDGGYGKILDIKFSMHRNPIIQFVLTGHQSVIVLRNLNDQNIMFSVKLSGMATRQLIISEDNSKMLVYGQRGRLYKMNLFPDAQEECYPYITHSIALNALNRNSTMDEIKASMEFLRNYYSHQYGMNIISVASYLLNGRVVVAARDNNFSYFGDAEGMAPFDWFYNNHDVESEQLMLEHSVHDMEMYSHGINLSMWGYLLKNNTELT